MKERFEELVEHLVSGGFFLEEAVEILEKAMIERVLARTEGNRSEAAKILGIHRNTLQRRMAELQLTEKRPRRRQPARAQNSAKAAAASRKRA